MATRTYPFLTDNTEPDSIGSLQHFRVVRLIGEGGMGYVFEARDTRLERPVALKIVKPALAANRGGQERFLREARAMASIRHENVVTVYDVGKQDRFTFLAMELLEGETLASRLADAGKLNPRKAVAITRQVCRGLRAAHEANIIHRDIKPGNIWLQSPDGGVRVLDFGLARNENSKLTQVGRLLGTPRYLSPEQARSEPVDARSDLYSVGVTLYQMLSGCVPHNEPTPSQQLAAVVAKRPVPIEELCPGLPGELATLVRELLQKKSDRRPQTADEVIERLDAIGWKDPEVNLSPHRSILNESRMRRKPKVMPRWLRRFAHPQSWAVLACVLFPALIAYQFGGALFPASAEDAIPATTFVPSELDEPLPQIASRETQTTPVTCGLTEGSLFSLRGNSQASGGEYVNLAFQPTFVREAPVMQFELSDLRDKQCVDAMLSFTLRGGATSSGTRNVRVYAIAEPLAKDATQTDLETMIRNGIATDVGSWVISNAGYRKNGRVDGIRFTSTKLIDFVENNKSSPIVLCLWRIDASNGQTHIFSDPEFPERLPKLWLKFAG